MHLPQLIERKRDDGELSPHEIHEIIAAFTRSEIPDYQMSALAMAIFFRGMSTTETVALTAAMRDSGTVFTYPPGSPLIVDKHSTGGVGDKISLILAPLLACTGVWVPMVSGRGLGITGGTLDKLESIPGFNVHLTQPEALVQLDHLGVFMAGQTENFCPADKKLYALRDVTGTVPSQPLIVASILSKKLAESLNRLVLDVKFGSGAFMKTREQATELAATLAHVAQRSGVRTTFLLSEMNQPLGHTVGNALEVAEAVETLHGHGPTDIVDLTLNLAASLTDTPREEFARLLASGAAWEKFTALVTAQGGDPAALDRITEIHPAPLIHDLAATRSGILTGLDAGTIGRASVQLGSGRRIATDKVDFAVGFSSIRKIGDHLSPGDTILRIHARTESALTTAIHAASEAISVE